MNASNLYPADHLPARIWKVDKMFESTLDFTDINPFKRFSQNSKKELHQRQYDRILIREREKYFLL